jgi:hypothetical protein
MMGPIMPWDNAYFKRLGPVEERVDWNAISEYFSIAADFQRDEVIWKPSPVTFLALEWG